MIPPSTLYRIFFLMTAAVQLLLLNTVGSAAELIQLEVVRKIPHSRDAFTQGLLYHEGMLYESTGLYKKSSLRRLDPETGEVTEIPKRFRSKFNFSIYNVNNQANPYFVFIDNTVDATSGTIETQAKQVSLFPVLPAITWNFEF